MSPAGTHQRLLGKNGLYKLIMRSRQTHNQDLPELGDPGMSSRLSARTALYIVGEEKVATGELDEDAFVLKAIGILQAKVERLKAEKEAAEA